MESGSGWLAVYRRSPSRLAWREVLNVYNPDIADSYPLMNDAPRLRGLVEEFKRDLQLEVLREAGAAAG